MIKTNHQYRAHIPKDDGGDIRFKWHFPKGMLKPRMSGLELAGFILSHMPHVIGFFSHQPRVYAEFAKLLYRLVNMSEDKLDEVLPWIRVVYASEEDDIIYLNLNCKTPVLEGPKHFVMP